MGLPCFPWNQLPLFIGLSVGIAIGLILTPMVTEECQQPTALPLNTTVIDEYEPRVNLAGKPVSARKEPKVLIRPRYYSTELGLREKLFVAFIVSNPSSDVFSLAVSVNQTLGHYVDRLAFFMETTGGRKVDTKSLPVIGFVDSKKGLLPLHVLKYLSDNFLSAFNYFLLVRDTTYVKGKQLSDLIDHLSISEDVFLGSNLDKRQTYCTIDGGIVISHSVLEKMTPHLEWCAANVPLGNDDIVVGRCAKETINIDCLQNNQDQEYSSLPLPRDISSEQVEDYLATQEKAFTSALTVHPVHDPAVIYQLHRQTSMRILKSIDTKIDELKSAIVKMAELAPGGVASLTWPVGSPPRSKPASRHDVIRWDYFNETHIFLDKENTVVKKMIGVDKQDIEEVLSSSRSLIESKYPNLKFSRLVNGYRRYDPVRGMDYLVDMEFIDSLTQEEVWRRLEGTRLLTKVEPVPMPYVTENTRVNLIAVVEEKEVESAKIFLQRYYRECMSKKENTILTLVLLTTESRGFVEDPFIVIKDLATNYTAHFKKDGLKVTWQALKIGRAIPTQFATLDLAMKKLNPDSLILLCSLNMQLSTDFLNRVRMNTIAGLQVFSPIPFSEYNPAVAYRNSDPPEELDVTTAHGFYDEDSYHHISFYAADYIAARKNISSVVPIARTDRDLQSPNFLQDNFGSVTTMFVKSPLHVLRGVEPFLRLRYVTKDCSALWGDQFDFCVESKLKSQGTRPQLAKLVQEYHEKQEL